MPKKIKKIERRIRLLENDIAEILRGDIISCRYFKEGSFDHLDYFSIQELFTVILEYLEIIPYREPSKIVTRKSKK